MNLKAQSILIKIVPQRDFLQHQDRQQSDDGYQVCGDLTIKDISSPVILDAVLNKQGENPMAKKATVGFNATTIKRSEFKMGQFVPNVSYDITISISTEAMVK